ncbi:MAG: DMT family transporter [Treponema sp.]|nr:DMT family transporter [Treponema sp.]
MNKRALRADILLLITAGLWGFGFVAQSAGMDYVGPFTFNAVRFPLGTLSLVPLILFFKTRGILSTPHNTGHLAQVRMTLIAGTILFVAVMFQQIGMIFTTVGNAGFITGFYVVLTPVFGIFIGKKTGLPTWIGMVFAFIGLYFIFAAGNVSSINPGDLIILISASFWAVHILVIDHLVQKIDPLVLSAGQFAWCGAFSILAAFVLEPFVVNWARPLAAYIAEDFTAQQWTPFPTLLALVGSGGFLSHPVSGAVIPILYGGIASVGIAYTLQVVAQKDAPPAHATIILCLEGCFAAVGGILLRNEKPGSFTLLGFGFMLVAMFVTQWDVIGRKNHNL